METSTKKNKDGYKWVVAFCCCFINCMLYGVSRLSGMLLIPLVETFGISRASAALPFSISSCVRNLSGPFAGYFSQYFGIRPVVSTGCVLASIGSALCYFSDNILGIVLFWGIIFGTGLGLSTTLMPLAINQNFMEFQSTASGISYSGAYIGSFVFPPLLTYVIEEYGVSGSFLIISGTVLHSIVATMLLRSPVEKLRRKMQNTKAKFAEKKSKANVKNPKMSNSNHDVTKEHHVPIKSSNRLQKSTSINTSKNESTNNVLVFACCHFPLNNIIPVNGYQDSDYGIIFHEDCLQELKNIDTKIESHLGLNTQSSEFNHHFSNRHICECCTSNINDENITLPNRNRKECVVLNPSILKSNHRPEIQCYRTNASALNSLDSRKLNGYPVNSIEREKDYFSNPSHALQESNKNTNLQDKGFTKRNTFFQKDSYFSKILKRILHFNKVSYSLSNSSERYLHCVQQKEYIDNVKGLSFKPFNTRIWCTGNLEPSYSCELPTSPYGYCSFHDGSTFYADTEKGYSVHLKCDNFRGFHTQEFKNIPFSNRNFDSSKTRKKTKFSSNSFNTHSKCSDKVLMKRLSLPEKRDVAVLPFHRKLSKRDSSCSILNLNYESKDSYHDCFLDWLRNFSDPMFLLISGTMSLFSFTTACVLTIIEDFAKDSGVPQSRVHFVLMALSAADLVGTLTLGWITDKGFLSRHHFTAASFVGIGVAVACIPLSWSFDTLLVTVTVYGILESGVMIMFPLLTAEYIDPSRHAIAIASSSLLSSPVVLLVPLVIGHFRDQLGEYNGLFYLLSVISMLCCTLWLIVPHFLQRHRQEL